MAFNSPRLAQTPERHATASDYIRQLDTRLTELKDRAKYYGEHGWTRTQTIELVEDLETIVKNLKATTYE